MIDRIEETLRNMLSDPSAAVREAASAALDRIRAKRTIGASLEKLGSGTVEERLRIVYAAGEIGGTEGVAVLVAALSQDAEEVRGAAVRTLEGFLTAPVLQTMVRMLPREKGVVLCNILDALGKSRRKELCPFIEKFMAHADPEVRARAIMAYARVSAGGWEKVLLQAGSPDDAVRAAVARSLGEWTAT